MQFSASYTHACTYICIPTKAPKISGIGARARSTIIHRRIAPGPHSLKVADNNRERVEALESALYERLPRSINPARAPAACFSPPLFLFGLLPRALERVREYVQMVSSPALCARGLKTRVSPLINATAGPTKNAGALVASLTIVRAAQARVVLYCVPTSAAAAAAGSLP